MNISYEQMFITKKTRLDIYPNGLCLNGGIKLTNEFL